MEEKNGKPSELAEAMMRYLDCECRYFPPMRDDTELCAAYRDARRDAADGAMFPCSSRWMRYSGSASS